jgi:HAD superfamily phosphoserine phosphatase-like hydrolase
MKKVYAFDFDGTLTKRDTFIRIIVYARGWWRLIGGLLLFSPILVMMKLRLYPNWKAKQQVFSFFFKGMSIDAFDELCRNFAHDSQKLLRKKGVRTLSEAVAEGSDVVIVSASIINWVEPFFSDYGGAVKVEGTKIDVRNDIVTGKFLTKNCYGEEKVKRISRRYPNRKSYYLIAFGGSKGDRRMLDYADEAYYRWRRR